MEPVDPTTEISFGLPFIVLETAASRPARPGHAGGGD